jgi:maleate isomerase|tara:strand:+ start:441 stop:1232 length:792 start_codon:yes stop_codon:yes gene_type:complete
MAKNNSHAYKGCSSFMTDILGWRKKFGVLGPSTNTIVQPEFDAMRPSGVTNHYSRIYTSNAQAVSNESFLAGTTIISDNVLNAVDSVMTCSPDYLVMGMSAITFYGGIEGANNFMEKIQRASGIGVSIGSHSTAAALHAYGNIKRIAFVSPYFSIANREVRKYFEECEFSVAHDICLECPSWTAIAEVPADQLRKILDELNSNEVDALVQVGTNLCMAQLAGEVEATIKKPVIAINTATYWHALRSNGIKDKIPGFGKLLEEL